MTHRAKWKPLAAAAMLLLTSLLAACATPERLPAVPNPSTMKAELPGMSGVRYFAQGNEAEMIEDGLAAVQRWKAYKQRSGASAVAERNLLAVSGGGDNGAFGAGLLVGWTAAGTRPEFDVVTGVSTGSLTAPFAFLGPAYDAQLKEVYTTISSKDVMEPRFFTAALFDDAVTDNAPLFKTVSKYATKEMLDAIGREYREKGRMLLIATTDLDARRSVIWNIGKLAETGHPDALTVFRRILVASAAIPGVFPPTMFTVEADGQRYQEMHVDGGAMSQVIVYPPSVNVKEIIKKKKLKPVPRNLYVIRNDRLDPEWSDTERSTLSIVGRAISSLIHTQGIGDLYQLYLIAERDGVNYNVAFIGPDFTERSKEPFDPVFMGKLFDYGYKLARNGYPWEKYPPGFMPETAAKAK